MSNARFSKVLQRLWLKNERARWKYGTLGRTNADATVTITVPNRSDYVYVQMDTGTETQALNKGKGQVPLRAGLPVRVRDENGVLIVDGVNELLLEGDAGAPDEYGVLPHRHTFAGLNDVAVTEPNGGDVPIWDAALGKWVNGPGSGGSGPPEAHAGSHLEGGADPLTSQTPVPFGVPQAHGFGFIDFGWIDPADVTAGLKIPAGPPAASTDDGEEGEIRFDIDYLYVCVALNSWKRVALTTW